MLNFNSELKPSFFPLLCALILCAVFIFYFPVPKYSLINKHVKTTQYSYRIVDMADSLIILKKAFEVENAHYIFNSSHLTTFSIPTHPAYFFNNSNPTFLIGGGGHQNLINILNLASINKTLKDKKIVVILSSQWFSEEKGISESYFKRWFHEVQLFETLDNPHISNKLKSKIISRLMEMNSIKANIVLSCYLFAKKYNIRGLAALISPIVELQKNISIRKENNKFNKITSEKSFLNIPLNGQFFNVENKFNSMYALANKIGKEESSNNDLGIKNDYYNTYISQRKARPYKAKGLLLSKEYEDLRLFCDLLKELQVEPLFVIIPMHARYLDQRGFYSQHRNKFYELLKSVFLSYGFETADFSSYEYEDFFLSDIMHIGWVGWLRVNIAVERFYAKQ